LPNAAHTAAHTAHTAHAGTHATHAGTHTAAHTAAATDAATNSTSNGLLLYEGPSLRGGPGRGRGLCQSWDGLLGILWRQNCQQNEVRLVHGDAQ